MRLINQSYQILKAPNRWDCYRIIQNAGRTCYKSQDKITDQSAKQFVKKIMKLGHLSVIQHVNLTAKFITNRGVSHQFVRHRLASYSQQSTRYCNYGNDEHLTFIIPQVYKKFIKSGCYNIYPLQTITKPPYYSDESYQFLSSVVYDYQKDKLITNQISDKQFNGLKMLVKSWSFSEKMYHNMINCKIQPQIARAVLPIGLKTQIVVTANLREWLHIKQMRTSQAAHPDIRGLLIPFFDKLHQIYPEIF